MPKPQSRKPIVSQTRTILGATETPSAIGLYMLPSTARKSRHMFGEAKLTA